MEKSDQGTGRKSFSARLFLKPFSQAASLRDDPVVRGLFSLERKGVLKVYLVGGMLRNLALSRPKGPDYDLVVDADTRLFAEKAARLFSAAVFLLDKKTLSYRAVVKPKGSRPGVVIDISPVKGGGIVEDLRLRDFTVNSMGMELAGVFSGAPCVIDPAGGLEDAAASRLSATAPRAFDDDPLRVLRAVRISQQYGLRIAGGTRRLICAKAALLKGVSVERVRDELIAVFTSPGTPGSIETCYDTGIVEAVLPELAHWGDVGGYRLKAHSIKTVARAEEIVQGVFSGAYLSSFPRLKAYLGGSIGPVGKVALFKLSAMLHDAGKPLALSRESGALRFIGHDELGAPVVRQIMRALKFSAKAAAFVALMARNHHRPFMLAALANPSVRARAHFFRAVGGEPGIMLLLLALADARATRGGEDPDLLEAVNQMLAFYYGVYTRKKPRPLLNGKEIMEIFNVPEGRSVGAIIDKISEGVERGAVSSRSQAVEYVRRWIEGEGSPNID